MGYAQLLKFPERLAIFHRFLPFLDKKIHLFQLVDDSDVIYLSL